MFKPSIGGGFPARSDAIAATPCGGPRATGPPTSSRTAASVSQNLPVSPPVFNRDKSAPLPALISPSTSIHLHCCPGAAHLTVPSQMRLARSLCRGQLRQADGQTDRQTEAEIASGLPNSASPSRALAPLISISLSLAHSHGPSRPLLLSFSPIKSLLPVCISSRSRGGALTRSFSLAHLASLLFLSFSSPLIPQCTCLAAAFNFSYFFPLTLHCFCSEVKKRLRNSLIIHCTVIQYKSISYSVLCGLQCSIY